MWWIMFMLWLIFFKNSLRSSSCFLRFATATRLFCWIVPCRKWSVTQREPQKPIAFTTAQFHSSLLWHLSLLPMPLTKRLQCTSFDAGSTREYGTFLYEDWCGGNWTEVYYFKDCWPCLRETWVQLALGPYSVTSCQLPCRQCLFRQRLRVLPRQKRLAPGRVSSSKNLNMAVKA